MFGGSGDDEAEFLVGEAASLEPMRGAIATGNEEAIEVALKQLLVSNTNDNTSEEEERLLEPRMAVVVSLQEASDESYDDEEEMEDANDNNTNNDNNNNGGTKTKSKTNNNFQDIAGYAIITSERLLFVASNPPENTTSSETLSDGVQKYDLSIDAECIHLHAQSAEPVSIYLQLENEDDETNPTEVTIIPQTDSETEKLHQCEVLFSKLSELISLHPISPDDDNNDDGGGGGGGGGMMMMEMMNMMMANAHTEDYGDDMVVAPSLRPSDRNPTVPNQFDDCEEDEEEGQDYQNGHGDDDGSDPGGATTGERDAMLARLDSVLHVPPELEIKDDNQSTPNGPFAESGQFDDAEDQEDDSIL